MKKLLPVILFIIISYNGISQFSVEKYKEYLQSHMDMNYYQLLNEFPAGRFLAESPIDFSKAEFSYQVRKFLKLTPYEESLINKNGFMVTERNSPYSFLSAYYYIFNNDLPVYISADAILHAMHYSFNKIYKKIESYNFYHKLDSIIIMMRSNTERMFKLSTDSIYQKAMRDYDIYFTIAANLLNYKKETDDTIEVIKPYFQENKTIIDNILLLIDNKIPEEIKIFSSTKRLIDFSQFTPRGKYTETPKLQSYFKTMIWFGYIEIAINDAEQHYEINRQKADDLKRQTLLSVIISKSAQLTRAFSLIRELSENFKKLIGSPDNITIFDFIDFLSKYDVQDITLFTRNDWSTFLRYHVSKISSVKQLYNSQILFSDIQQPEKVKPSLCFKLFGQIPVIDGFISSNVVYDNIIYEQRKVARNLPNTLDILFSIGNDGSIQLLEEEINKYKYSSNLAALRYLISSYDTSFWYSSIYNNWLYIIESLNPELDRKNLPNFMQTAAWWQKSMNTQLASWSQLRHDFILNVKQPYTLGYLCSFPHGFVDPVPELYKRIAKLFTILKDIEPPPNWYNSNIKISENFIGVSTYLEKLAEKELKGERFDNKDSSFISRMISTSGCVTTLDGWYVNLYDDLEYFQGESGNFPFETTVDITVADVHTQPTDEEGTLVGNVLHSGTGYPGYSVLVWENPDGIVRAYTGAVYSYFETVTNNFKRLTDEEWKKNINEDIPKHPKWCNLYLANKSGGSYNEFLSLLTELPSNKIENDKIIDVFITPNPASDYIEIDVGVNGGLHGEIVIYDIFGQDLTPTLSEGEGVRIDVSALAPGLYFVRIGVEVHKFVKL